MKSMRVALSVTALAATGFFAETSAAAPVTYIVENTPVESCSNSPHGLWTSNLRLGQGSCRQYYSIQPGSTIVIDEDAGTGRLTGTAKNPSNVLAEFDISLTGWLDSIDGTNFEYKRDGGPAYDVGSDTPDINFFTEIGPGSVIKINNVDYLLDQSDPFTGNTVFQYGADGIGANAKNNDLGASAWINIVGRNKHWDFNLNFSQVTPPPPPPPVSEPATLAIIGAATLLGFAAFRRRASSQV